MIPFINDDKNIVFWWSAKCGCSTVKSLMFQMMGLQYKNVHRKIAKGSLAKLNPNKKYIHIAFVRNIFDRFVSGFLDKHIDGNFTHIYKPLNFLDATRNINLLEKHHFTPQTSECFNNTIQMDRIYDITNINYTELSKICNFTFTAIHTNANIWLDTNYNQENLCTLPYDSLCFLKQTKQIPAYKYFYNSESKINISLFYQQDIEWFQKIKMKSLITL